MGGCVRCGCPISWRHSLPLVISRTKRQRRARWIYPIGYQRRSLPILYLIAEARHEVTERREFLVYEPPDVTPRSRGSEGRECVRFPHLSSGPEPPGKNGREKTADAGMRARSKGSCKRVCGSRRGRYCEFFHSLHLEFVLHRRYPSSTQPR